MGLLDLISTKLHPQLALGRLGHAIHDNFLAGLAGPEQTLGCLQDLARIHVPNHNQSHVLRTIIPLKKSLDASLIHLGQRRIRTQNRSPIAMLPIDGIEHHLAKVTTRHVLASLDLFTHHLLLPLQLLRVESSVLHRIRQHIQPQLPKTRSQDHVVNSLVIRRPGVDVAARRLNFPCDFTNTTPQRALEQHMFMQMSQTELLRPLIGGTHINPNLNRHHGGGPLLVHHHRQTVGQTTSPHRTKVFYHHGFLLTWV